MVLKSRLGATRSLGVAGSNHGARHQQERVERALRLRHRAQVGRADEPRTARARW
jgi:hypothetical protein